MNDDSNISNDNGTATTGGKGTAHFIGICGAGMSGVALLLRDQGWEISGSDAYFYPPVSDALTAAGLPCRTPYAISNIPADVRRVVIGKHARLTSEYNEEVAEAFRRRDAGLSTVESYPDVLEGLTQNRHNIVVAGSYGKSSTSALLTWFLLNDDDRDPGYFIGAVPLDLPHSAHLGTDNIFVLEGDEYPSSNWDRTPKFCRYNACTVLLTSCEHDHHNEFATLEEYLAPYRRLVGQISDDNLLVACRDGAHVLEVAKEARCRVVTYTSSEDPREQQAADYYLAALEEREDGAVLTIGGNEGSGISWSKGKEAFTLRTNLFGRHNAQNIVGAVALLNHAIGLPLWRMADALPNFHGLRRRLERKNETDAPVALYEDLSSSRPKALAALSAVRARHKDGRLIAIFQPHTFSFRSQKAKSWYDGLFAHADAVLVFSPPELEGLGDDEVMGHEEILQAIHDGNPNADVRVVKNSDETVVVLASLSPALGDAVLMMTSGAMGGAIGVVQTFLESRPSSKTLGDVR